MFGEAGVGISAYVVNGIDWMIRLEPMASDKKCIFYCHDPVVNLLLQAPWYPGT